MSEQRKDLPGEAELADMSRDDLVKLGTNLDGVELVHYADRWPVKGTRAERRAERGVAAWFILSGLAGLAFVGVYLFWPWRYKGPFTDGELLYSLYTPMLGLTLGVCILALGIGVLAHAKRFFNEEIAVQQRHDGPSDAVDQKTIGALLGDAAATTGLGRRSMIKRSVGFAGGMFAVGAGLFTLGGLVRDPWKTDDKDSLWHTGWKPENGEKIYLRRDTGDPHEVVLVRPEDLDAGGFETVFPFRESERNDPEKLLKALRRSDNPVMLIRLRPNQQVVKRKGQEDFNYGDYYAYSKICTHLGCPTSLYEQQTGRLLCPCHQSQFDVFTYGKPMFGPATRALPQLPITVDEDGYFVARGDFIEPIGPGFWERKS
ncbi:menaquinol-cytochrome c reductase iron-sulfur subunit precursor [Streptoalloteichus tenebrarius]|uniref:Cytochrome bc1 complex Rieske iron-sulfur subunit n=1 Tax=Streptoalloteichus tenebrarius (strain ATCC 17920 / DSM 40477 / JCM 4838 / CBS 697.72 / NBRC 16177 / NCIMB 11028 / NRRL B-12390 / A12253. 1 / ISP 5477) TaxID=1933 RepID=A0ABT1HX47_STRSD|nr:ubiquinol-cytochrome c reductase iron-sulfur subunit [Streptoalloteichus tenebrarius]MCP2260094.1 menaquinol-cytochrome c reductase iron-sulfur subunit precursor [Streptoalloteichus tenebrarius]